MDKLIDDMELIVQEIIERQKERSVLEDSIEQLKIRLKVAMKERNLSRFSDSFQNTATLVTRTREHVDKDRAKELLGDLFKEVDKISTFEVMTIAPPKARTFTS